MTRWDDGCNKMIQELDNDVIGFIAETEKRYRAAMAGTLDDRFDTRAIDSGKLHKHFRRLTRELTKNGNSPGLEATAIDRLRELRGNTAQYDLQVLRKRNTLGHVRESEGPDGWVLEGGDISLADFPNLRGHIRRTRRCVSGRWSTSLKRWMASKPSSVSPSASARSGGTAFATCVKRGHASRLRFPPVVYGP